MRQGWSVESPKCGTGSVQHARFAERVGAFPVTTFSGATAPDPWSNVQCLQVSLPFAVHTHGRGIPSSA